MSKQKKRHVPKAEVDRHWQELKYPHEMSEEMQEKLKKIQEEGWEITYPAPRSEELNMLIANDRANGNVYEQVQMMSLEEIIQIYGDHLTPEQIEQLRNASNQEGR